MNSMKAPKILPWVAKKAGISEELALKLWRRAVSEAEFLTGESEGSRFWSLAAERFQAIVDDEASATACDPLNPAPHMGWMLRHQTRMSLLSMVAAQNTYRFWQNTWENLYPQKWAA